MQALNDSFRFFRNHWQPVTQLALVFYLPLYLLNHRLAPHMEKLLQADPETMAAGLPTDIWPLMLFILALGVLKHAAIMLLVHRVVHHQPFGVFTVLSQLTRYTPWLLLSGVLFYWVVGFGLMLFILPGAYIAYRFLFLFTAVVVHNHSPLNAIRDSIESTRGEAGFLIPPLFLMLMGFLLADLILSAIASVTPGMTFILGGVSAVYWTMLSILTYRLYQLVHDDSEG